LPRLLSRGIDGQKVIGFSQNTTIWLD